jgi:hypothetical protein
LNPRDFLTTAAIGLVLVVGGLAIADSLRGCDTTNNEAAPARTTAPTSTAGNGPTPQPDAPEGWPEGELEGVITFVDADSCVVRSIGLSGGRERPLTPKQSDCQGFWAPPISARIAYTIGVAPKRRIVIQIADLGQGDHAYGNYTALGDPVWSADGQRIAWCDSRRTGLEREVLGAVRGPPFCPLAYTPQGNLVHAEGRRLVLGTKTIARAPKPITWAQFGSDGGGAFVVRTGFQLERFAPDAPKTLVDLPGQLSGAAPSLSPDSCRVAVPTATAVRVLGLCSPYSQVELPGHAPAWSPNGDWLATATYPDAIVFHRMNGSGETVEWPGAAVHMAWRSD